MRLENCKRLVINIEMFFVYLIYWIVFNIMLSFIVKHIHTEKYVYVITESLYICLPILHIGWVLSIFEHHATRTILPVFFMICFFYSTLCLEESSISMHVAIVCQFLFLYSCISFICCVTAYNYHKLPEIRWLKPSHIYYLIFSMGSRIQVWLRWVLCSGSHRLHAVKVPARLHSHLET